MSKRIPRGQDVIFRGDDRVITVAVVKADGSAEDVTGWTSILTLRTTAEAADPAALTVAGTVGAGTDGVLTFTISSAQTLTLTPGKYACTVKRTNAGSEDTITDGIVTVKLDVRHAAA